MLDNAGSLECGDSVATFITTKSLEQLTDELSQMLAKNARVYLIGPGKKGGVAGQFVLGRRRRAAWSGYAAPVTEGEEEA